MRQAKNRELTVLFVTHAFGSPAKAGNELRILRLAQWLSGRGNRVFIAWKAPPREVQNAQATLDGIFLFPLYRQNAAPQRKGSSKEPLNPYEEAICPDWLSEQVESLEVLLQPDIIVSEYIFMSRCLKNSKASLKIIDTHDVFSRRKKMVESYGIKESYFVSEKDETKMLSRADLLLAIQNKEAAYLKKLAPSSSIITCGVDFDEVLGARVKKSREQYSAIIVASDNPANRAGVQAFLKKCWPMIKKAKRNATLLIVGGVCESVKRAPAGVKLYGLADDISEMYGKCQIALNPVAAGTGLKVKTVEALAYGKPVVSFPNGLEGISEEGREKCYFGANDWNEFATKTLRLLQDSKHRRASKLAASKFSKNELSSKACYKDLKLFLNHWFSNLKDKSETT